jgi:hypothetical protein
MARSSSIFQRAEIKYLVTDVQRQALMERIGHRLRADEFGRSTVLSAYFDTPDWRVIRASVERPFYKEKLRLRSYGTPESGSTVYLELKKKCGGTVYKRRQSMTLAQAKEYLATGRLPVDTQIMREIDFCFRAQGNLRPAVVISSEREAMYAVEDRDVRLTFDEGLRYRTDSPELEKGSAGSSLLPPGVWVMEIKVLAAMPLWLSDALRDLELYPSSFSKYGTAYQIITRRKSQCSTQFSSLSLPTASPWEAISSAR